jgi:hypothetical protein
MWKGFIKESYSFIEPKGIIGHIKFLLRFPKAYIKFKWYSYKK